MRKRRVIRLTFELASHVCGGSPSEDGSANPSSRPGQSMLSRKPVFDITAFDWRHFRAAKRVGSKAMEHLLPLLLAVAIVAVNLICAGCTEPAKSTLQSIASPAVPGSAEPHLARALDGTVLLSWLQQDGDNVALRYATVDKIGWGTARTVARGDNWFVNWADFPSVIPITSDLWAAHWLTRTPGGTYAYDVTMALSTDAGMSWGESFSPHTDGTRTEHGFVSLFPWQGGVGALWLDGRNTHADQHDGHGGGHGSGGMTLRSAVVTADRAVAQGLLVDELVCDCCQTDVAISSRGPVAVYRNRTAGEVRDIYVSRAINGQWEPGQAVANDGWEISGCPVNGPAIAASGEDIAIAWFTAAGDSPRVLLARSRDAAQSFSQPIVIDGENAVGRVDVELMDDGNAVVSWLRDGDNQSGGLAIRVVSGAGMLGPIHRIEQLAATRPSGFPQMVADADGLVFAWTDSSPEQSMVRTARITQNALQSIAR